MNRNGIITIATTFLVVTGIFLYYGQSLSQSTLDLNQKPDIDRSALSVLYTPSGEELELELATSVWERVRGLSNRESLPLHRGLLFVFEDSGYHSFWMKDMNFPIDIIWLDEHFKVVDIKKEVSPNTYPTSFSPVEPAKYVLEINANQSDVLGIMIGEMLDIAL